MPQNTIIIGLTGGIGMGKSTLAKQFAQLGAKVCNADDIVHQLLSKGGAAVNEVKALFPTTIKDEAVDRKALGNIVFKDKEELEKLEQILHPLVVAEEIRFVHEQQHKGTKVVVLEIPLLFETGADKRCDYTVVASAPFSVQKERVLKRPNMTEDKFHRIVASQMPDSEKQAKADYVISTGTSEEDSFNEIKKLMSKLHAT